MKKLFTLAFILLAASCFSQTKNFIDQNYIEVTGKAELELVPNEIYLEIILDENDLKGKSDIVQVEKSMIEELLKLGIDVSKALAVKDFTSEFKDYWIQSSDKKARKVFQLKVTDANTAGAVFQKLAALEISQITIERLDHSELLEYKQQVKIAAIKAAKQKATAITAAIDQTCGKAIYIEELNNQIYRSRQYGAAGATSNMLIRGDNDLIESKTPEIEFEKIKLEYSILARFELD